MIKTWSQRLTPESTALDQLRAMQAEIDELRVEFDKLKQQRPVAWVEPDHLAEMHELDNQGIFKEWITRPVHALPWHHDHINCWQAHQWHQTYEAIMVINDFGVLVRVQK